MNNITEIKNKHNFIDMFKKKKKDKNNKFNKALNKCNIYIFINIVMTLKYHCIKHFSVPL